MITIYKESHITMYIYVEQHQNIVCIRDPKRAQKAVWVNGVVPLNVPINPIALLYANSAHLHEHLYFKQHV